MRLSRNNKGSTIVLVIVVLAFVGILASTALWISLANFQMKVTDKQVTDNFYTAETVLDQINVGLQNDISQSLGTAYLDVMQKYSSLSADERETQFSNTYMNDLRTLLKYTEARIVDGTKYEADMLCATSKLMEYVNGDARSNVVLSNAQDDSTEYCCMSLVSDGLLISNLVVEYTDPETNELSVIQTDLILKTPDLNLISSEGVPDVFDYALIGNTGIEISGPNTVINASIYAGSLYAVSGKNTTHDASISDDDYYESFVTSGSGYVDFSQKDDTDGATYVIADGDVWLNNATAGSAEAVLTTSKNGQLWARNINIAAAATALLSGTVNVSDDLTLSGQGADVSILGTYTGYGFGTTGDEGSSAILINGKDSVLDMSNAESVVVAGYGYINTSAINATSGDGDEASVVSENGDIQLGESILVKGDQIAYLVPTECVGIYKKNPLTVAEYKTVLASSSTALVDTTIVTKTGKTLADYMTNSEDSVYQMVLVPSKTGNSDDGLVYLYLNLDADMAKTYFCDYYSANRSKLEKYVAFYSNGIHVTAEQSSIYTAGIYADYVEGEDSSKLTYDKGKMTIDGGVKNLANVYQALTTKLLSDPTELSVTDASTVFDNVIEKDRLKNFLSTCTGRMYSTTFTDVGGIELHVLLMDNENSTYTFSEDSGQKHVHIIVSTGNVNITSNFTGTVIALGKVTVGSTSNNTIGIATVEQVKKMLSMQCTSASGDTAYVFSFFKDGNVYISSGFGGSDEATSGGTVIDMTSLVEYRNWKKK